MEENKEVTENNTLIFPYGNRMITLILPDLNEIDYTIDDLLSIDYSNILAETLTFSVVMNRLGLLLAEADRLVRVAELNVRLGKDQYTETKSKLQMDAFKELKKTINAPTAPQIEGQVLMSEDHKIAMSAFRDLEYAQIQAEKQRDEIKSIYWSAKSKDEKLNVLVKTLKPDEFEKELVETTINGILVRSTKKLFE